MSKVIEFDRECEACKGTGVYAGMAEKDGAAIVCSRCKGTGCDNVEIKYEPFRHRHLKAQVVRVYQVNPGVFIGGGKICGKELYLADFGGMDYHEWLKGVPFPKGSENRRFTCPSWWYQSADYKKKPDWEKCSCLGLSFSACEHFGDKAACWEQWDDEN